MLRLADIILLKAEAIANQEDTDENRKAIMKLVNQIRRMANLNLFLLFIIVLV